MRLLLPKALRTIKERTRWATGEVSEDGEVFAQHVNIKNTDSLDVKVTNQVALNKDVSTVTLIDDVAFTATVTSEDINLSKLKHGIITAQTGAISSGSPTLQVKLQLKDSNGNYIDYLNLPTVSSASTVIFDDFYFLPFSTGRLIATFGGTGGFNNVTVELQAW